ERPPYAARHRKFWPFSTHLSTRPVSAEIPSRLGPRASGQSPRATRRGAWATASTPTPTTSAAARLVVLSIVIMDYALGETPVSDHPLWPIAEGLWLRLLPGHHHQPFSIRELWHPSQTELKRTSGSASEGSCIL